MARADELAEILKSQWHPTKNLLVDLSRVAFMDSTGLEWLFNTNWAVRNSAHEMRVIIPEGGHLERLFEVTEVSQVFSTYHNLDKALDRISSGEPFVSDLGLPAE